MIPRAVLAEPEEDMDVLVGAPGGEERGEARVERARVVVGGDGGLGRGGEQAERADDDVVEGEPCEGKEHDVACLDGVGLIELGLGWKVVVVQLRKHPPRIGR